MADRTYPELTPATDVQDTDLVAAYRAPGPLKKITALNFFGAPLRSFQALTPAADKLAYFTSASAMALTDITAFARTLLDDADATTARTTLAAVGLPELAASTGAALIGSVSSATGAVARTVQAKQRDIVSVKDFGAVGDGSTDDTAAFNLAIAYANAKGGTDRANVIGTTILIPQGRYPIGQLNPITVSSAQFVGESQTGGVVLLHSYNGATFSWIGPVSDTIVGGGLTNVKHEYLGTPGASACIAEVTRANSLDFSNWFVFNIACALRLGTASNGTAAGILAHNWVGGVRNMDAPVVDLRYGAGFFMANPALFVSGVVTPPIQTGTFTNGSPVVTMASTAGFFAGQDIIGTARVPAATTCLSVDSATQLTMSANATSSGTATLTGDMTTAVGRSLIRGTVGFWDTCQISGGLLERFDQGFTLGAGTGQVYQNFELCNTKFDYTRRHCVYMENTAGGVINAIASDNLCWFVSWEEPAISMNALLGVMDDCDFQGKVTISGKEAVFYNNLSAKRNNFTLDIGAPNRLQSAPAAMNFVTGSTGFSVVNCRGNDDLTSFGTPFRADWAVLVGLDCDNYVVNGCRMSGTGGFFNWFAGNAAGSRGRQVTANGNPGYAELQTGGIYALPATTVAFTNSNGFAVEVIIAGGTVTSIAKNGTTTGLTAGSFIVGPGDTLTPTYAVAPTWSVFGLN